MITKAQRTAEVIEFDRLRLGKEMERQAFVMCDHEARCFELCFRDRQCINQGIIWFAWVLLVRRN